MKHADSDLMNIPELLAPAGDRECVRAAVENGADAVYFGLDSGFNARARATNFDAADLAEMMDYLHRRCVRGYVTLNTLAFTDELPRLEETARVLVAAHVDAVLVQDLGVARLLREVAPDLELHASTQMTLSSAECIAVARDLGIQRVVLPRELSIDEIREVRCQTDIPLEAFVHGALCVAWSGQCLTSESLGGRSANRGQCAQACRLPYDLICDGRDVDLGDQKYLLSPQDLAAFELTSELIAAGICSFKIEGRLKTPEYVANTVKHYRAAIDAATAGTRLQFSRRQVQDLEMSFSRGFSPGWLQGCDHKMLVPALSSTKRGVLLGRIVGIHGDRIAVQLQSSIAAGDGIVFEGDRETNSEQGGRVYEVLVGGIQQADAVDMGEVELTMARQTIDFSTLRPGLQVWKTDDPRLNKRLRASFTGPDARKRVPVDVTIEAVAGAPLRLSATAANGARCHVESEERLQVARKHALSQDLLRQQLGRLGSTVFVLRNLSADISGQPMLPLSVLGRLRRQMIEQLEAAPLKTAAATVSPAPVLPRMRQRILSAAAATPRATSSVTTSTVTTLSVTPSSAALPSATRSAEENSTAANSTAANSTVKTSTDTVALPPRLSVLCRSLDQLQAVVREPVSCVYVDFADIREYREAVRIGRECSTDVIPATPRIQKPGEMGIFKAMLKHQPAGVLVRNLAGLAFFSEHGVPVVADFSLNVTNELTAEFLMERGVQRLTASYDMNRDQLLDLVDVIPAPWLEVVIHQHMPMFHMEHCVFCSVLSPGTNKTNCGRPCDVHRVELRDRTGMEHPLTADVGCRNTLFNATPQSSAEVVPLLLARGLRNFRVELLNDDTSRLREILSLYRSLLAGQISGSEVWQQLKASNRVGVTRGTLEERRNPLAIL
ncbi:MAG: DUF3656 domain-containing protein [Fuerstiella sp.]